MQALDHRRAKAGAALAELGFEFTGYDGKSAAVFKRPGVGGSVRLPSSPRVAGDQTDNALMRARKLLRRAGAPTRAKKNGRPTEMPKTNTDASPGRAESGPLIMAALRQEKHSSASLWTAVRDAFTPPHDEKTAPTWFHQHILALEKAGQIKRAGTAINADTNREVTIWAPTVPLALAELREDPPEQEQGEAAEENGTTARAICGAESADGKPCIRLPGHWGSHQDNHGHSWDSAPLSVLAQQAQADEMTADALLSELGRRLAEPSVDREALTIALAASVTRLDVAAHEISEAAGALRAALEIVG